VAGRGRKKREIAEKGKKNLFTQTILDALTSISFGHPPSFAAQARKGSKPQSQLFSVL